jgi:hypothetical protein
MTIVQLLTGLSLLLCLAGLKREGVPLPPGLIKIVSPSSWEA